MASIQCRNCKYGIHYHGEPSGIEFVRIDSHDWEKIVISKFDSKNKIFDPQTGYPKLFRTDTIAEDFPDVIKKFWKCPKCGSLLFFDEKGRVIAEYLPKDISKTDVIPIDPTAIYFDDYQWDEITESGMPVAQLAEKVTDYNKIYMGEKTITLLNVKTSVIQEYRKMK